MSEMTPAVKEQVDTLLDHVRKMREYYGLPPTEPPAPPTFAEIKAAEDREADLLIEEVIRTHGGKNDLRSWSSLWYTQDRPNHKRNLPRFLMLTAWAECWTDEALHEAAHDIWTLVEWPAGSVGGWNRAWRSLLERVGFECDAEECLLHIGGQRGTENIEVFRGAFASEKRGLSWTTDPERAEWFAGRGDMAGKGRVMHVYRAVVPANRVYAHHVGRGEDEIVCDVKGLKIETVR